MLTPQGPTPTSVEDIQFDVSQFTEEADPFAGGFVSPKSQATGPYAMPGGFDGWRESDVERILRSMPEEELARVQQRMAAVGLGGKMRFGFFDETTADNFLTLLDFSNQRRQHWRETLNEMAAQGVENADEIAQERMPDVYRPPDYDSVAQSTKDLFKQSLGRDPTDSEMAALAQQMMGLYRQSFDSGIQAAEMQESNVGAGRVIEAPPQVDPIAKMRANIERKYAGEIEAVEDVGSWQATAGGASTIFDQLKGIVA